MGKRPHCCPLHPAAPSPCCPWPCRHRALLGCPWPGVGEEAEGLYGRWHVNLGLQAKHCTGVMTCPLVSTEFCCLLLFVST